MIMVQLQGPVIGIHPLDTMNVSTKFKDNPLGNYQMFLNLGHSGVLIDQPAEIRPKLAPDAALLSSTEKKLTMSIITRK